MTSILRKPLALAAITAMALLPACAQPGSSSKAEIEKIVREYILANPEIIEDAQIALMEKQQAARLAATKVAIGENTDKLYALKSDYTIGPADAKVTVVEFFDYRCGFCKTSVDWVRKLPEAQQGRVRVVFKELPIFGGVSETAALATLAAGKQGKYVDLHVALMKVKSNDDLTDAKIDELAAAAGINVKKMRADMKSADVIKQLNESMALGQALAITGTPSFFIGDQHIEGAKTTEIEAAIKAALAS